AGGAPNNADWPAASSSAALGLASSASPPAGSPPNMSPESPMRAKVGAQPGNVMATIMEKRSRATRCHPLWLLPSGPDQVGGRERPPDSRAGIWPRPATYSTPPSSRRKPGPRPVAALVARAAVAAHAVPAHAGMALAKKTGTVPLFRSAEIVRVGLQLEPPRRGFVDDRVDAVFLGVCDRRLLRREAQLHLLARIAAARPAHQRVGLLGLRRDEVENPLIGERLAR